MDFSGLVKAVQDFWNFIWPPVFALAVLYAIAAFLAPDLLKAAWLRLLSLRPASETQIAAFKTAKRFGFDKVFPVLVAFCLLFLLDGVRNLVVQAGHLLPPNLSYDQERLILAHADSSEVRSLWYRLGSPGDISDFQGKIERVVGEARETHKESPLLGSIRYWQDMSTSNYIVFDSCKFFLFWSVFVAVAELRITPVNRYPRTFSRLMVLIFLVGTVLVVFSIRFIWAVEQTYFATNSAALVFAPAAGAAGCDPAKDGCKAYYQFIEATQRVYRSPNRWWFISGTDVHYLQWLGKQATNELE